MNKLNLCAVIVTTIFLTSCQTGKAPVITSEQKIERAIATSKQETKELLEFLRSNGTQEDKFNFLNQDVFIYPHKLEEQYLKSKGVPGQIQRSGCPRICYIPECDPFPHPSDCGKVICEPDPNCLDCKPGKPC